MKKDILSFEMFDHKMSMYENITKKIGVRIHSLSPDHPIKKHLKDLIGEIKSLPEDVFNDYLDRRVNFE